jgi:hypothetical protein
LVGFCRDCLVASGEIVFDNEIVKPFMQWHLFTPSPSGRHLNHKYPSNLPNPPDCCKNVPLAVSFGGNGNSYTISTQSDMCIRTHICHNIGGCLLYDVYDMIWYSLLTAVGQPPGGSSSVHIYTQTIHRTTQNKQCVEQHKNLGRVRTVPHLCGCYPGIWLTTEEKARQNLSQGSRRDI